jgi:hypothetical protein
MKRWSHALLLVVAALSFVLPVTLVEAQVTTDTEVQQGTSLAVTGSAFIQQLSGQYGANAKVVDVVRNLLLQLGPEYQRALAQANRDRVQELVIGDQSTRAALVAANVQIDAAIAALDPLAPNYATLLAAAQASRASNVARIATIDAALPALLAQRDSLDAALAALPAPVSPYLQANLSAWLRELDVISAASQAATLGDFVGAGGILIDDGHVVAVPSSWGNAFGGRQAAGVYVLAYALGASELVDQPNLRTPNRDYSYQEGGGLITVNVEVTTHYYGFMAITAASEPTAAPASIPVFGPFALWLSVVLLGGAGALALRRSR